MVKLKATKSNNTSQRYPTLQTILMVEEFLKKHKSQPVKISELRQKLPRQVMHQTLKLILEYLFQSKKIIYEPEGIRWIFEE
jgi:hypothetical protein